MRILVLSGPNLDRLGTREPSVYGTATLAEIHETLFQFAMLGGFTVECRQSAHEGDLVSWINTAGQLGFDGLVVNAGAYTHTSIALLDAVKAAGVPAVEVHLSNPDAREPFRRRSYIGRACLARVSGFGAASYRLGLQGLVDHLRSRP